MVWKLSGISLSGLFDRKETFAWYNTRHIDGIHSNRFKQKPSTSMLLTILLTWMESIAPKNSEFYWKPLYVCTCFWVDFELRSADLVGGGVDGVEESLVLVQIGGGDGDDVGSWRRVLRDGHHVLGLTELRTVVVYVQYRYKYL